MHDTAYTDLSKLGLQWNMKKKVRQKIIIIKTKTKTKQKQKQRNKNKETNKKQEMIDKLKT